MKKSDLEILKYLGRGMSVMEIGELMEKPAYVVKNQIRHLRKVLNASNKYELVSEAIKKGIIDLRVK